MGLGFPRARERARTRGHAADVRRHDVAVGRAVPGGARRCGPGAARTGRPARPVRAQGPQGADHPHGSRLCAGRGPQAAVRRLGQRRRPRTRRAGDAAHLGGEHPRVLRRRGNVLAGERAPGRAPRLARHQPQPAGIRRERRPRLARRVAGDPGQTGHGRRQPGRRRPRRSPRPLHGGRRGRAVRPRSSPSLAGGHLSGRGEHPGLEGTQRRPPHPARADRPRCRPHGRSGGCGRV